MGRGRKTRSRTLAAAVVGPAVGATLIRGPWQPKLAPPLPPNDLPAGLHCPFCLTALAEEKLTYTDRVNGYLVCGEAFCRAQAERSQGKPHPRGCGCERCDAAADTPEFQRIGELVEAAEQLGAEGALGQYPTEDAVLVACIERAAWLRPVREAVKARLADLYDHGFAYGSSGV
jgi:hypothetical protein